MIGVLLMFTRAQRDGNWLLHLQAFKSMLPYFYWYNQTNYARWEVIYLNEMNQLPQEVKEESKAGNFVVKRSPHRFNQVEPDQSQEWLSGVGKKSRWYHRHHQVNLSSLQVRFVLQSWITSGNGNQTCFWTWICVMW